jgi:chemotaxis protein methyltransferase WspC
LSLHAAHLGSATALVTAELRRWIREATGVQITDENAAPVALALRIQAENVHLSPAELRQRLIEGSIGPQDFIDEITTHESYFFRAREQMQLVVEEIIPQRLRRAPDRPVRVLSLPCARGEEPYSLGILLEEAGIPPGAVEILGADIAHSCIEAARVGTYSALALRRTDQQHARHWFRRGAGQELQLDQSILRRVSFRRVNILRDAERLLRGPFDIVFCENLLIYFDASNVQRALGVVERLMAEDGWLFVDHAEWSMPRGRFLMQEWRGRVGFRPRGADEAAPLEALPSSKRRQPAVRGAAGSAGWRSSSAPVSGPPSSPRPVDPGPGAGPTQPSARPAAEVAQTGARAASNPPKSAPITRARRDLPRRSAPVREARAAPTGSLAAATPAWQPYLDQAQSHYEHKRFTEAILGFERLLGRHPNLPQALLGKARVLADCGEDFEAMELLETLVATDADATGAGTLDDDSSGDGLRADALG